MFTSGLSFILSILVIFFILKKDLFRVHSYKILTYISVNDLLRSLTGFLQFLIIPSPALCSLYGFIDSFSYASNPIWALCLTYTIFQIIVQEETSFEKFHKFWVFLAVPVVAGIVSLPFITESYGYYDGFCLIKNNELGDIWRFSILYIPISVILAINILLSFRILKKVNEIGNVSMRTVVLDRGMIYTFVILVVFIPLLILRVVVLVQKKCAVETSIVFFFMLYNAQGFFNGIAFFYNKTIRFVIFQKRYTFDETMLNDINSLRISYASDINN